MKSMWVDYFVMSVFSFNSQIERKWTFFAKIEITCSEPQVHRNEVVNKKKSSNFADFLEENRIEKYFVQTTTKLCGKRV